MAKAAAKNRRTARLLSSAVRPGWPQHVGAASRSRCCRRRSASRCARRRHRSQRCRRRSALTLPPKPKTSASKAGRTALWLGPDEWLVIDEAGRIRSPTAPSDRAAFGGRHLASQRRHRVTGPAPRPRSMPAARRTCRSTPSRSAPARARSSARSRSCCSARRRRLPGRMLAFLLGLCLYFPSEAASDAAA